MRQVAQNRGCTHWPVISFPLRKHVKTGFWNKPGCPAVYSLEKGLPMNTSAKATLIASLIGSAFGTGLWWFGIAAKIWPAHPQWAVFILTILCTVLTMRMWPADSVPQ